LVKPGSVVRERDVEFAKRRRTGPEGAMSFM
jgi:hypothetical protein